MHELFQRIRRIGSIAQREQRDRKARRADEPAAALQPVQLRAQFRDIARAGRRNHRIALRRQFRQEQRPQLHRLRPQAVHGRQCGLSVPHRELAAFGRHDHCPHGRRMQRADDRVTQLRGAQRLDQHFDEACFDQRIQVRTMGRRSMRKRRRLRVRAQCAQQVDAAAIRQVGIDQEQVMAAVEAQRERFANRSGFVDRCRKARHRRGKESPADGVILDEEDAWFRCRVHCRGVLAAMLVPCAQAYACCHCCCSPARRPPRRVRCRRTLPASAPPSPRWSA
jgi:hypothetical protein